MSSKSVVPILVAGMLITGCANSLLTKWQDNMCIANCEPEEKLPARHFEQPVWQTLNMFVGEMLCFLPVIFAKLSQPKKTRPLLIEEDEGVDDSHKDHSVPLTGWKVCWLWIPALCDLTATTLMGVGLIHIPVSIYQMTRGALVLWVGVLSVILLRTRLFAFQWFSLITVMFGVGLVGLSGSLIRGDETDFNANAAEADPELIMGMSLVLLAQLFAATQFVIEDKIMKTYSVEAMLAVGWEGFFGTFTILLALPVIAYFPSIPLTIIPPASELTSPVLLASFLIMFSIASFNYFGLSVTRSISATARSTIDTCRTLGIWVGSVMLGWEKIKWPGSVPQFIGFGLLVYGTFLFNGLVNPPSFMRSTEPAEAPLIGPATTDSDPLSGAGLPEGERRPLLAGQASA
ncbi:Solute carrier family 35 member F6 OS=Pongo abelii GN=SLC35F6 PE=2 SV=1 [Rhizoctonia solani AG-1 IB]|uniref:Solute carrier family 35 member F6 n=1 Tax=Thanatephorus cucumeris (strain AG1-IB / isolate 7/3/14) TaxID=1108050 RepID=M5C648_THACB|nr:Transmembrane protein C2orf18 homolog [Rhizoctonia solani AG-1 IB]CEL58688.1 Solute carrier family 35 member F6 OS=Pongo abelii GN=SLC35F6 PE=2 SV=1 [Rhizoctonia solani AG-1 IB]